MHRFFIALSILLLSACANFNATLDTARAIWGVPTPKLVPGFEYLEVAVDRHIAVMALGSRQQVDGAWIEQWFTGQGEMLELRNGRIQRVLGMTHELRQTRSTPPLWGSLLSSPARWQRERQAMPGYQMRQEQVASERRTGPVEGPLKGAVWIEEQVSTRRLGGQAWHYTERFALREGQVVYSEQCVSPELCLKLRPLGVAP